MWDLIRYKYLYIRWRIRSALCRKLKSDSMTDSIHSRLFRFFMRLQLLDFYFAIKLPPVQKSLKGPVCCYLQFSYTANFVSMAFSAENEKSQNTMWNRIYGARVLRRARGMHVGVMKMVTENGTRQDVVWGGAHISASSHVWNIVAVSAVSGLNGGGK